MIAHSSPMESFSAAASAMAEDHNVLDIVAALLLDLVTLLPAESAAIMMVQEERVVPLAASSHRASEVEMLQMQALEGPCSECITGGASVSATGEVIHRRWGRVGGVIQSAGYQHVSAFPLRWHDRVL